MELLLIGVTVVSLGIALAMSIVSFTLLRRERQRSAARVEALEAMAFTDIVGEEAHAPDPLPIVTNPLLIAPKQERLARTATDTDEWDFALGGQPSRDAAHLTRTIQHDRIHRPVRTEDLFEHAPAPGVAGRRWLAIAAVVLAIGAGVAIFSALRSPELIAAIDASRSKPTAGAERSPLELLSLRHITTPDGTFTVTGLVQNPADGRELGRVEAVVYLFDDGGRLLTTGRAGLEVPAVSPGDESPFLIKVATTETVNRYRVGFRTEGRVVAHVDRRGQLPSGTTGDVLAEPELARPAGGMKPMNGAAAR